MKLLLVNIIYVQWRSKQTVLGKHTLAIWAECDRDENTYIVLSHLV